MRLFIKTFHFFAARNRMLKVPHIFLMFPQYRPIIFKIPPNARAQVLGFGGSKYILGGQDFYYKFEKTVLSATQFGGYCVRRPLVVTGLPYPQTQKSAGVFAVIFYSRARTLPAAQVRRCSPTSRLLASVCRASSLFVILRGSDAWGALINSLPF